MSGPPPKLFRRHGPKARLTLSTSGDVRIQWPASLYPALATQTSSATLSDLWRGVRAANAIDRAFARKSQCDSTTNAAAGPPPVIRASRFSSRNKS